MRHSQLFSRFSGWIKSSVEPGPERKESFVLSKADSSALSVVVPIETILLFSFWQGSKFRRSILPKKTLPDVIFDFENFFR
ncbi:hypothetical protein LEP1GSC161_4208 [Leptospira santarosai str. CBC1416]|uniref:Uncharacterized protein n=1 Tax=Leptospira santarosai str. CBC1416 TaxID=1193059 RepID=M6VUI3_9LEPT|nr:hypothetical protein LEP1GSC161_4208 [Leptospira santarosai str. CBC1416]